jgi:hypothetical protein
MSDLRAGHSLTPGRFLVLISVRGCVWPKGFRQLQNPVTSMGKETTTSRLAAHFLIQIRYPVPSKMCLLPEN